MGVGWILSYAVAWVSGTPCFLNENAYSEFQIRRQKGNPIPLIVFQCSGINVSCRTTTKEKNLLKVLVPFIWLSVEVGWFGKRKCSCGNFIKSSCQKSSKLFRFLVPATPHWWAEVWEDNEAHLTLTRPNFDPLRHKIPSLVNQHAR